MTSITGTTGPTLWPQTQVPPIPPLAAPQAVSSSAEFSSDRDEASRDENAGFVGYRKPEGALLHKGGAVDAGALPPAQDAPPPAIDSGTATADAATVNMATAPKVPRDPVHDAANAAYAMVAGLVARTAVDPGSSSTIA